MNAEKYINTNLLTGLSASGQRLPVERIFP